MRAGTVLTGLIILALTGAGASLAGEMSGSGEAIVVSPPPKETPLPDGGTFLELHSQDILLAPGHPFHHVAITCIGTCTIDAGGGAPMCAGGCTGQDPDGDVITFSYDGLDRGGWDLLGGTGKWSGASGSGTWKTEGPMGAGFTRNTWSGSIEME